MQLYSALFLKLSLKHNRKKQVKGKKAPVIFLEKGYLAVLETAISLPIFFCLATFSEALLDKKDQYPVKCKYIFITEKGGHALEVPQDCFYPQ